MGGPLPRDAGGCSWGGYCSRGGYCCRLPPKIARKMPMTSHKPTSPTKPHTIHMGLNPTCAVLGCTGFDGAELAVLSAGAITAGLGATVVFALSGASASIMA